MEQKQTAVEWLYKQLAETTRMDFENMLIEAKEMEKQQIIDAHNAGKNILPPNESGEQYYKEEYGK